MDDFVFPVEDFSFSVEVVRTDRKKSASIQLDGVHVKVSVPKTLSKIRVRDLIAKKSVWIKQKIKEVEMAPPMKPKEYVSGETFPYLGKNYRLKVINISDGSAPSLTLTDGYFKAYVSKALANSQEIIKSLLVDWYKEHASIRLAEKTERLAKIIGIAPNSVRVKGYKSRWGSCSPEGNISYNWRIILTPHRIIDYVVIHELCHLLELNHSSRFWKHVAQYAPDWKERKDWLKNNPTIF